MGWLRVFSGVKHSAVMIGLNPGTRHLLRVLPFNAMGNPGPVRRAVRVCLHCVYSLSLFLSFFVEFKMSI